MTRTNSSSSPARRRITLLSAAAAAATALVATASSAPGAAADIIARPPFFVPQRADNLILSGGRDAGDWESLHALADAGLPCYGNMCERASGSSGSNSAMDNNPGAVQKSSVSRNIDQSYVGHSQPIGSSVEGGAFDSAGRLADPAATLSAAVNPAAHGGGGSMFAGAGSAAAQEVAASFANGSGSASSSPATRLAWDPSSKAAPAAPSATAATATTAAATTTATATTAPAAATTAPVAASVAAAPPATALSSSSSSSSSTMETLAAVERAPTAAFPTTGKKATTPAGGVAFATGEHEYLRAEKAIDETLDDALEKSSSSAESGPQQQRLPPAPRGPAGRAAVALVGAAQGAAERVAGAASTGVNAEGQPPADDAEAFSMAVANAAGKIAKKLGQVASAGGGGGRA